MKLVAVLGSSREGSKSKAVAQRIIDSAKAKGAQVEIYEIDKMNLKGCVGCGSCRKNGTDCVLNDDMKDYFKSLHSCDSLLITAPNYYSMPAGQMITFMNRHYCLTNADRTQRLHPGIRLAAVFAQGAPQDYPKYVPHYDWYLSTFTGKGMELVGSITVGGDSDISENGDIMTKAEEIGCALGSI